MPALAALEGSDTLNLKVFDSGVQVMFKDALINQDDCEHLRPIVRSSDFPEKFKNQLLASSRSLTVNALFTYDFRILLETFVRSSKREDRLSAKALLYILGCDESTRDWFQKISKKTWGKQPSLMLDLLRSLENKNLSLLGRPELLTKLQEQGLFTANNVSVLLRRPESSEALVNAWIQLKNQDLLLKRTRLTDVCVFLGLVAVSLIVVGFFVNPIILFAGAALLGLLGIAFVAWAPSAWTKFKLERFVNNMERPQVFIETLARLNPVIFQKLVFKKGLISFLHGVEDPGRFMASLAQQKDPILAFNCLSRLQRKGLSKSELLLVLESFKQDTDFKSLGRVRAHARQKESLFKAVIVSLSDSMREIPVDSLSAFLEFRYVCLELPVPMAILRDETLDGPSLEGLQLLQWLNTKTINVFSRSPDGFDTLLFKSVVKHQKPEALLKAFKYLSSEGLFPETFLSFKDLFSKYQYPKVLAAHLVALNRFLPKLLEDQGLIRLLAERLTGINDPHCCVLTLVLRMSPQAAEKNLRQLLDVSHQHVFEERVYHHLMEVKAIHWSQDKFDRVLQRCSQKVSNPGDLVRSVFGSHPEEYNNPSSLWRPSFDREDTVSLLAPF